MGQRVSFTRSIVSLPYRKRSVPAMTCETFGYEDASSLMVAGRIGMENPCSSIANPFCCKKLRTWDGTGGSRVLAK